MFKDRIEAGKLLAKKLSQYKSEDAVVLGIPRGGMPVAFVISKKLNLPLSLVVTRKIGAPVQKELAIGAVGPGGVKVFDQALIKRLRVDQEYIEKRVEVEKRELKKRIKKFGEKKINLEDKVAILVDDGIATGATVEAAIKYLRKKKADKIILAVPVSPKDSLDKLGKLVDKVVVLNTPLEFYAVGQFYRDFPQVSDEEVVQLLQND